MTPAQSRGWHSHRTAMVWTVPCRAISFGRLLSQKEAGLYLGWTDPVRWARRYHLGQCTNGNSETKGFVLNKLYSAIEVWWRKTDRVLCNLSFQGGKNAVHPTPSPPNWTAEYEPRLKSHTHTSERQAAPFTSGRSCCVLLFLKFSFLVLLPRVFARILILECIHV